MRYGKINKTDIANGPGVRVSLFVSGCRNRCKGCFNPETWDFDFGDRFTTKTIDRIYDAMAPDYISGLTILGGDPMEPENRPDVQRLCKVIKALYPEKTIWIYTGYLYENLKRLEIMEFIDALVDGPFIEEQKDLNLKYRGSRNQRIINIPATRASGKVTLKSL